MREETAPHGRRMGRESGASSLEARSRRAFAFRRRAARGTRHPDHEVQFEKRQPRLPAMEDTRMLDDAKGLFADSSFTIIPNGLSEDRSYQVSVRRASSRG